jgi:hypothetical protein
MSSSVTVTNGYRIYRKVESEVVWRVGSLEATRPGLGSAKELKIFFGSGDLDGNNITSKSINSMLRSGHSQCLPTENCNCNSKLGAEHVTHTSYCTSLY